VAARTGAEHDRGIDDIGGAAGAAQLAGFARATIIEDLDLDRFAREQARETRLSSRQTCPPTPAGTAIPHP